MAGFCETDGLMPTRLPDVLEQCARACAGNPVNNDLPMQITGRLPVRKNPRTDIEFSATRGSLPTGTPSACKTNLGLPDERFCLGAPSGWRRGPARPGGTPCAPATLSPGCLPGTGLNDG